MLACLPAVHRRRRTLSDQEGVFIAGAPEKVQQEIAACIKEDLVEDVRSSLDKTRADLKWGSPCHEETSRVVMKTYSELSDYVNRDQPGKLSRASTIATENDDEHDDADLEEPGMSPSQRAKAVCECHGLDFSQMQGVAADFLRSIGLRPHEVGSRNFSKWRGRTLWNQCFYLSMAYAYLGHQVSVRRVRGLARRFRQAIEAVVLEQHPSWAEGLQASTEGRGQAMVFADFLPLAMRAKDIPAEKNLLAKLVVCIMDSVNGHVEVYIGPGYHELKDRSDQVKNLMLLWYKPAHYQCLVRDDDDGSKLEYTYDEFKQLLSEHGVVFIETLE